jgi:chromate transport protein ChrA
MVLLTMAYSVLQGGPVLELLSAALLPAALAFIALAALKLGREVFRLSPEFVLAAGAFTAILFLDVHPMLILLGTGLLGALALGRQGGVGP